MADRLELRVIDDEGNVGRSIGGVRLEDGELAYHGSGVVRDVLESVATRRSVAPVDAFGLLYAEPWCNAKLVLQAASSVFASDRRQQWITRVLLDHLPGEHDQDDHAGGKAKAALAKARAALAETLRAVPGARDDHMFDPGGEGNDSRPWINFEGTNGEKIAPTREFEFNTDSTEDQETVTMSLDLAERQQFASALAVTLARDEAESSDNPLVASLLLAGAEGGAYFGNHDEDGSVEETGRYIDWSTKLDDGGRRFEVGHGDEESITFELTPAEMRALHATLTLSILEDEDR
jgi:hypothetical protein